MTSARMHDNEVIEAVAEQVVEVERVEDGVADRVVVRPEHDPDGAAER